ncbi:MAG: hypothetical protein STHCBS139747_006201 [Sporothrix thermara]
MPPPSVPNVTAPSAEQHATGFGIGSAAPRLSWRFVSSCDDDDDDNNAPPQDWLQTAYEIEVLRHGSTTPERYRVESGDSVLVPWPSTPLTSREQAKVRVRVYGRTGDPDAENNTNIASSWSPWTIVEAALLSPTDWQARVIASGPSFNASDDGPLRPVIYRRSFKVPPANTAAVADIDKPERRARLYITSLGVYRAYINGMRVGDQEMAPGWTSYKHRLNYQVYDVASLLRPGLSNVLAVEVAEGWYAGRLGFRGGRRFIYGDTLGVLAQLEMGEPGNSEAATTVVSSDESWTCRPSALLTSEIYDGEVYDAREEEGLGDHDEDKKIAWQAVRELPVTSDVLETLVVPEAPPVRITEEVSPVALLTTPSGKTVLDFGQNLVGRLLVRSLHQPSGHTITFAHAEVLEKDGELGTRPLRHARCTDTVISAGEPITNWSPRFTFHGFRYVAVDGWSPTDPANFAALVLHTDLQRTGYFTCSHPMVNKLHENAWWSMRGNFLSIPTDCPQRDERLGWTGDIQVFTPSASFLYNTAGMLGDWLQDVMAEQLDADATPAGVPPFVVPNVIGHMWPSTPQAIWDDVTVLTPWDLYRYYGDVDVLRRQYPSMKAWLDQGVRRGPDNLWHEDLWQLGDWLDPTAPPEEPGDARTSGVLVADAYLVHVTGVMAQVCGVLGRDDDAARYGADALRLKAVFQAKYLTAAGMLVGDTQTGLSLALVFGLFATPAQTAHAAARLVKLVRLAKFRVATGFAGTPLVLHALTLALAAGGPQVAYRMLLERNRPSWMYPITLGATTIWERWDSMLPDGSINPGEMTSFNHYALGSVINWLHTTVAGVSPLQPGWRIFLVAPVPGGTITSASATYETPYGRLECSWRMHDGGTLHLDLLVPANSRARVVLPHERAGAADADTPERWVGSGRHRWESPWDNLRDWPPKPLLPMMRRAIPDSFV